MRNWFKNKPRRIEKKKKIDVNFYLNVRFRICMSIITLQATCRFTFNKSGYIFPYVDSVYYTQLSREWESRKGSTYW